MVLFFKKLTPEQKKRKELAKEIARELRLKAKLNIKLQRKKLREEQRIKAENQRIQTAKERRGFEQILAKQVRQKRRKAISQETLRQVALQERMRIRKKFQQPKQKMLSIDEIAFGGASQVPRQVSQKVSKKLEEQKRIQKAKLNKLLFES